jgi:hypothetical protein
MRLDWIEPSMGCGEESTISKREQPRRPHDHSQGYARYGEFTHGADHEWPQSLLPHLAQIRAQADTGERQQKSPTGKICEVCDLRLSTSLQKFTNVFFGVVGSA